METKKTTYEIKLVSTLEKVFDNKCPVYRPECMLLTGLKGETVSFQAACTCTGFMKNRVKVEITSPIKEHILVRSVECVPAGRTCGPIVDDNYLKTESGMYPDLGLILRLQKRWNRGRIRYRSLWNKKEKS